MIPVDTAPPPSVVRAVCTVSGPQGRPVTLPCIVIAAQERDVTGIGFLIAETVSMQFLGVLSPGGAHIVVTHIVVQDGDLHPVNESGCDVDGVQITCYTPGATVKAVIQ